MSDTTTVPVTQAELTNTDINHATKIGKQVIVSKLNEELDKAYCDMNALHKEIVDTLGVSSDLVKIMEPRFELVINNCSQMSKLRCAINTFEETPMRNNMKMVTQHLLDTSCTRATNPLWLSARSKTVKPRFHPHESFKTMAASGEMEVTYFMGVAWRNEGEWHKDGNECYEDNSGFTETVTIPEDFLEKMRAAIPNIESLITQQETIDKLQDKLDNIDKAMEEMEAKLLVNELNRTDRGKEVLAVTNNIIGDVLGSDFKALTAK